MRFYIHITFLICLTYLGCYSQKEPDLESIQSLNIVVQEGDMTIKTQVLKEKKTVKTKNDLIYFWYSTQKIMQTQGGYDGKLLHGYYNSFYASNQLREQGSFRFGIKNGLWKNWYTNGQLKEVSNWKQGLKNGEYYLYNEKGLLMAKSNFKQDALHGDFYTYDEYGKIVIHKKYKQGKLVEEPIKSTKLKQPQSKDSLSTHPSKKRFFKPKNKSKEKNQTNFQDKAPTTI